MRVTRPSAFRSTELTDQKNILSGQQHLAGSAADSNVTSTMTLCQVGYCFRPSACFIRHFHQHFCLKLERTIEKPEMLIWFPNLWGLILFIAYLQSVPGEDKNIFPPANYLYRLWGPPRFLFDVVQERFRRAKSGRRINWPRISIYS
jgi:hypothetical protein